MADIFLDGLKRIEARELPPVAMTSATVLPVQVSAAPGAASGHVTGNDIAAFVGNGANIPAITLFLHSTCI